jgi:hypothetical protein
MAIADQQRAGSEIGVLALAGVGRECRRDQHETHSCSVSASPAAVTTWLANFRWRAPCSTTRAMSSSELTWR